MYSQVVSLQVELRDAIGTTEEEIGSSLLGKLAGPYTGGAGAMLGLYS